MFDELYKTVSALEIERWLRTRVAELLNVNEDAISADARFETFGIDSAKAISLILDLEDWLKFPADLPTELLFEAESIGLAAKSIFAAIRDMVLSKID
jgi:acyl carrier protein